MGSRLFVAAQLETVRAQVCRDQRDQEEVLTTGEEWKQAMMEKGGAGCRNT